jgi:hypothetical protein
MSRRTATPSNSENAISEDLDSISLEPVTWVVLGLTYEDGSSSGRNTYSVHVDGEWKRAFSHGEYGPFEAYP